MTITNNLNIKYKPWKISGTKDNKKKIWAETTAEKAEKRKEELEKDGWENIKIIEGKELEQAA